MSPISRGPAPRLVFLSWHINKVSIFYLSMRINEIITEEKMPRLFIKVSQLILKGNVWRSVWRICMWIMGLKGLRVVKQHSFPEPPIPVISNSFFFSGDGELEGSDYRDLVELHNMKWKVRENSEAFREIWGNILVLICCKPYIELIKFLLSILVQNYDAKRNLGNLEMTPLNQFSLRVALISTYQYMQEKT